MAKTLIGFLGRLLDAGRDVGGPLNAKTRSWVLECFGGIWAFRV